MTGMRVSPSGQAVSFSATVPRPLFEQLESHRQARGQGKHYRSYIVAEALRDYLRAHPEISPEVQPTNGVPK